MISDGFAELLVATFNDPNEHPVHLLFNRWRAHARDEVKDAYVEQFMGDPELAAFVDEGGRRMPNIQCVKWETMLDRPLIDVRSRYGMPSTADLSALTER